MNKPKVDSFADNLRLLCSYCHSVSEVCRKLEINRQQFARYLSGDSWPSNRNLRKICDFFGVEEDEISLPHKEFSSLVVLKPSNSMKATVNILDGLTLDVDDSGHDIRRYLGYYYRYLKSIEYPNAIIKAVMRIYVEDGCVKTKAIELLRNRGERSASYDRFKYKGVFLHKADRIFVIETDYILKNAITETILFPTHKMPFTYLFGKSLGISSGPLREPYTTPMVYEYLGLNPDLRAILSDLALYPEDSDEIDTKIRDYLSDEKL